MYLGGWSWSIPFFATMGERCAPKGSYLMAIPESVPADLVITDRARSDTWRWYICVLLLFATVVNYMDRLTTNTLAGEIQREFSLNNQQYGNMELGFGLAFAAGSLLFGWLVDRVGVFWLYPIVLVGWSLMGFLTGLSRSYTELLWLRVLLGLFEAGHFPCGLKTVQQLMAPRDRAMGNSLLQAGTALGAILAPQAIKFLVDPAQADGWRRPFLVIGAGGTLWVLFWLFSLRPRDLRDHHAAVETTSPNDKPSPTTGWPGFWRIVFSRNYLALAILVICINLNWHLWRVWLPKFLVEARRYERNAMLDFTTFYYIAADAGILLGGAASAWLARHGMSTYASRIWVFAGCCGLTTLTTLIPFLPAGNQLQATMLVVGFGGLGSFAAFYTLTQDLSLEHQGKLSGSLATITWLVTAAVQPIFGAYLDQTHNYDTVLALAGWFPMLALLAILTLWRRPTTAKLTLNSVDSEL